MSRLNFHKSLLTMSFGMTFAALTAAAQTQTLPHDTMVGHLETVATFNGPMPTGVTVSRTNRIFVNFPRWGDDVPFTVAEVIHGKTVAYPDAMVNDWPGRKSADPTQYKDQTQNENHFVSVQSVVVDPANRLWVLDTGSPMLKNALPGGPKLVAIDLTTNKIVKRILLPPSIAGPTSYMNDVRSNGVEVTKLVHDPHLLWPDTMSLSDDGYLYVTANQLFAQPSMNNGKDLRQKPYVLFRIKVDAKPIHLR